MRRFDIEPQFEFDALMNPVSSTPRVVNTAMRVMFARLVRNLLDCCVLVVSPAPFRAHTQYILRCGTTRSEIPEFGVERTPGQCSARRQCAESPSPEGKCSLGAGDFYTEHGPGVRKCRLILSTCERKPLSLNLKQLASTLLIGEQNFSYPGNTTFVVNACPFV